MKRFLYPCVIFEDKDNDCYDVAFYDLGIFTEAETIEKAYIRAKLFLEAYCECAIKMESDFPVPTPFEDMKKKYPKDIVQLVFAEVGEATANTKKVPLESLFDDDDLDKLEEQIVPGEPFKLKEIE